MAASHTQALHLELQSIHAVYLVLPTSAETREAHRFQAYQGSDTLGRIEFEHMLDAMRHGGTPFFGHPGNLAAICRFYAAWRNECQAVSPALLIRQLQEDVRHGALAVFRFERDPHRNMISGNAGSGILPGRGPVSGWSGGQKLVAMFEAIPHCLTGAARAEFEAFLTPQNLSVMALFFGGIAVVQALPGADAFVDGMIAGLAWWQFGWAGLIAGKDFVEAVIKAGHARTDEEIKLAAAALVSLGLLVLLREIARRVHEVAPKAADAEDEPVRPPPRSEAKRAPIKPGPTESQLRVQRVATAKDYYQKTGWSDKRIEDHLNGIDFSKDVSKITLKGAVVTQWVDPNHGVGKCFAPDGTTPDQLGINATGRVLQKFVVTKDAQVLQSTAAPITDTWSSTTAIATGGGGGLQWFTADNSAFQLKGGP